jgi:hypothetical protein
LTVLPHTYTIPGLGQLEHYPGEAFMTHFVARCGQLSLDAFGPVELSGLMTVGDETLDGAEQGGHADV